jgi:hypothetical protein
VSRHRRLSYSNVTATLALFLALGGTSYAALQITGENVRNGSLTGADIKKHSVQLNRLRARLPQGSKGDQGPKGDQGATGAPGPKGATGAPGTDATLNGVAAGGDLAGAYPNPTLRAGAVNAGSLSPDLEQGFHVQHDGRSGLEFTLTAGPTVDGVSVLMLCNQDSEAVDLVNFTGSGGSVGFEYVRGGGTAVNGQGPLGQANNFPLFNIEDEAGTANDRGTGEALFWTNDGVWALDFSYDATDSYCSIQGVLRHA